MAWFGNRDRQADREKFFFCIPLKPKNRSSNWDTTLSLLRDTLRSILNQSDTTFSVFIAGHDRPDLPELQDSRVSYVKVGFRKPEDGRAGKKDQTRKMHFLGAVTKEHGGGYFMVVDSDDLVHKDLVRFIRSDDNKIGYMIRAGYILDASSGRLGRFSGIRPRQFFNHCGTSSIIYLSPEDLPDRTTNGKDLVDGNSFLEGVRGHGQWEAKLLEREVFPSTLPFRGSVYRLNTGENASYTYRRGCGTISRLIRCVDENPAPIEILESDFGMPRAQRRLGQPESLDTRPVQPRISSAPTLENGASSKPTALESKNTYAGTFYSKRRARTIYAAQEILKIVMERFPFRSAIDVGCGTGTWLDVARSLGAIQTKGLEGPWLDLAHRDAEYLMIEKVDLEQPISEDDRFDLAINLEVAEHLSPARAESFVDDLCRLSDLVLFGAAVPGQGGRGHVNEQWQSYWTRLFETHGYIPMDIVRPRIWDDTKIKFWYKQNTLLFCRKTTNDEIAPACGLPSLDVVHPEMLMRKTEKFRERVRRIRSRKGRG